MKENFTTISKLKKNKHLKYGVPFLGFLLFGAYVLSQTKSVQLEFNTKAKTLNKEEIRQLGIKIRDRPETLEEAFEKVKQIDIDNWENIRGPRLWDETPPSS